MSPGPDDDDPVPPVAACQAPLILCGTACIDPGGDSNHCGAQADCQGINAGTTCGAGNICIAGGCTPEPVASVQCTNCSFEAGNTTGWTIRDLPENTYSVSVAGLGVDEWGFFTSMPTDGAYALLHGFDGAGPGSILASQVFDLPAASQATLTFDYRAGWDLEYLDAQQNRTFAVSVQPLDGSPGRIDTILVATAGTYVPDTGNLQGTVDLTEFVGRAVRVEFQWNIPEYLSGPAAFQLDGVRVGLK